MRDELIDRVWFTGHGDPRTFSQIAEAIEVEVFIGSDSHRQGSRKRVFATAICLDREENGRRYFWTRRSLPKREVPNLQSQLLIETQQSIDAAMALLEQSPCLIASDITIHVDCSHENAIHKSGRSAKILKNMVQAYGFKCVIKPERKDAPQDEWPWAASSVGDRHAR